MPLQEADLKSYDAYKKAIRADVSKITDTSQTKFWVYKDIELADLKGKKNKIPAFLVLVDDSKARNFLHGKSLLCSGTCRLEQSRIYFEPVKGKVPFAKLKVSVPLLLGKPLYIPAGQEEDDGDEGAEREGVEDHSSETSTQPSAGAALTALWERLYNQAKQTVAGNPSSKEAISPAMAGIPDLLKTRNFGEAQKRLDALQQVLAAGSGTSAGSSGVMDAKALKEAWGKLVPRIKGSGNPALMQAAEEMGHKLSPLVSQGKLAEAQKLIEELAARLEHAKPVRAVEGTPNEGIAKYRHALQGFAHAESEFEAQIEALKNAILKIGPDEGDFADELATELEELNDELADAVDEAMKAAEDDVSPAPDAVKLRIRQCLAELESDPLVKKIESNPLGVKVTIGKTLGGALARIEDAMPA